MSSSASGTRPEHLQAFLNQESFPGFNCRTAEQQVVAQMRAARAEIMAGSDMFHR